MNDTHTHTKKIERKREWDGMENKQKLLKIKIKIVLKKRRTPTYAQCDLAEFLHIFTLYFGFHLALNLYTVFAFDMPLRNDIFAQN